MTPQETFITRLRRHRERNRISLDEIVSATRIKREQLEAFESGDLTVWPRGIYARAWIRGYAGVIGLDPSDTVDEFCRLFPQGDRRAEGTFRDIAAIVAHPSTYQDQLGHPEEGDRRRPLSPVDPIESHVEAIEKPATWRAQLLRVMRNLRPARSERAVRSAHTN
jgi:transcriptional regulator with XRE-family HTH domain